MRTAAETMKFAAIVADSSSSRNQCPTKVPLSAKKIGIGIAYFQSLSGLPLAPGIAAPRHPLGWYEGEVYRYAPGRTQPDPDHGIAH